MTASIRLVGLLAACASAATATARAQQRAPAGAYVDGGVTYARTRSVAGTLAEPLHGPVVAVAAGVSRWSLLLEGRYAQGTLSSSDPAIEKRDLTEGELHFGVRLLPALTVSVGPHARAYHASSGTRRWVFWEGRIAGTTPLIPSRLDVYGQIWGAVAGSTSLSNSFGHERGGEVGARVTIPHTRLGLQIAYRIDRGTGSNPARSDMLEQIVFAARIGAH